ncbi:hypothetical protein SDC9_53451 [bioreactor metagenome]|uniref:DUF4405 domain-containing protein n=1 Tax=bioreactor metagenome TaxID=1076179 RepID=A0A644WT95_9ZZZZ|nr:hypothetical protein [Macellibacteroides fermentans]
MDNSINWQKLLKRINIILMLATAIILTITTLLFETFETLGLDELDEIHELCGITFLILILVHLILYRKKLIYYLLLKN